MKIDAPLKGAIVWLLLLLGGTHAAPDWKRIGAEDAGYRALAAPETELQGVLNFENRPLAGPMSRIGPFLTVGSRNIWLVVPEPVVFQRLVGRRIAVRGKPTDGRGAASTQSVQVGWMREMDAVDAGEKAPGPGPVRDADRVADLTVLFANEPWYQQQAGKEELFRGQLEAVKPPQASFLMRTSWYRLGERTVYTGARKIPALDALVGQQVEIYGKAVEMQLEGQNLREIWPARVRPAGG